MKKNVYLIILTLVTVICIIGGTCYHLVGWGVPFSATCRLLLFTAIPMIQKVPVQHSRPTQSYFLLSIP